MDQYINDVLIHDFVSVLQTDLFYFFTYSQTCIKRSHLGQRKSGLTRQVTS